MAQFNPAQRQGQRQKEHRCRYKDGKAHTAATEQRPPDRFVTAFDCLAHNTPQKIQAASANTPATPAHWPATIRLSGTFLPPRRIGITRGNSTKKVAAWYRLATSASTLS